MTRALVTQLLEALLTSSVNEDNLAQTTEAITAAREYLATELAQSVEPYAVFHGLVDSGEHGAFNLDLLKMIPRGAYLYLHPPQPQATTPAASNDWLIRKEPNTKDKYYVAEGKPPASVLEIYEIAGEKP